MSSTEQTPPNFTAKEVPSTEQPPLNFTGNEIHDVAWIIFLPVCWIQVGVGTVGAISVISFILTLIKISNHNLFILNMAVTDLLTLGYWWAFFALDLSVGSLPVISQTHCVANGIINIIIAEVYVASLIFVSLNRYIHICHYDQYHKFCTRNVVRLCIVFMWITGIAFGFLPFLVDNEPYEYDVNMRVCSLNTARLLPLEVVLTVLYVVLPLTFVGFLNFKIFRFTEKKSANIAVGYLHAYKNTTPSAASPFQPHLSKASIPLGVEEILSWPVREADNKSVTHVDSKRRFKAMPGLDLLEKAVIAAEADTSRWRVDNPILIGSSIFDSVPGCPVSSSMSAHSTLPSPTANYPQSWVGADQRNALPSTCVKGEIASGGVSESILKPIKLGLSVYDKSLSERIAGMSEPNLRNRIPLLNLSPESNCSSSTGSTSSTAFDTESSSDFRASSMQKSSSDSHFLSYTQLTKIHEDCFVDGVKPQNVTAPNVNQNMADADGQRETNNGTNETEASGGGGHQDRFKTLAARSQEAQTGADMEKTISLHNVTMGKAAARSQEAQIGGDMEKTISLHNVTMGKAAKDHCEAPTSPKLGMKQQPPQHTQTASPSTGVSLFPKRYNTQQRDSEFHTKQSKKKIPCLKTFQPTINLLQPAASQKKRSAKISESPTTTSPRKPASESMLTSKPSPSQATLSQKSSLAKVKESLRDALCLCTKQDQEGLSQDTAKDTQDLSEDMLKEWRNYKRTSIARPSRTGSILAPSESVASIATMLTDHHMERIREKERKLARSLLVVFIMTCISFAPYGIVQIVSYTIKTVPTEVFIAANILLYLNNACNWLVYGVMNPKLSEKYAALGRGFVRCVKTVVSCFTCCCQRRKIRKKKKKRKLGVSSSTAQPSTAPHNTAQHNTV